MAAILITDSKNLKVFYEGVITDTGVLERKFIQEFNKATVTYRITDIGTSVQFKVEGTKDGTTYSDLFDSTETTNGSFTSGELDVSAFIHIRAKVEAITAGSPRIIVHTTIERFINPNVQIGGDDFSSQIEAALNNASAPTSSNTFVTQSEISSMGDMTKVVYDPTAVNDDAFDMENMAEGASNKILTTAERTTIGNQSGTNTGDEPTSTEGVEGVAELATQAEVNTGTDVNRIVTPDKLEDKTHGVFTGTTLTDNAVLKALLQELETAVEAANGTVDFKLDYELNAVKSSDGSFTVQARFGFDGTTALGTPSAIKALVSSDTCTGRWRVFDTTNSLVIATSATIASGQAPVIIDMGTLSNLPAAAAIWEIQGIRDTGSGGNEIHLDSMTVKF